MIHSTLSYAAQSHKIQANFKLDQPGDGLDWITLNGHTDNSEKLGTLRAPMLPKVMRYEQIIKQLNQWFCFVGIKVRLRKFGCIDI